MQAEYLKRRFEIKDDLHKLISGIELSLEGVAKMNEDKLRQLKKQLKVVNMIGRISSLESKA